MSLRGDAGELDGTPLTLGGLREGLQQCTRLGHLLAVLQILLPLGEEDIVRRWRGLFEDSLAGIEKSKCLTEKQGEKVSNINTV